MLAILVVLIKETINNSKNIPLHSSNVVEIYPGCLTISRRCRWTLMDTFNVGNGNFLIFSLSSNASIIFETWSNFFATTRLSSHNNALPKKYHSQVQ